MGVNVLLNLQEKGLAPVVQKVDSAIHWINIYPLDSAIGFPNTYPLDSDLSGGQRYPTFEQPWPGVNRLTFSFSIRPLLI